jgi:Pullulanase N2 domain/Carbohydrate-binding module 48 (Isoamylase N-terminal domain)
MSRHWLGSGARSWQHCQPRWRVAKLIAWRAGARSSADLTAQLSTQVHCRVDRDLMVWRQPKSTEDGRPLTFQLHGSQEAALIISANGISGATMTLKLKPCSTKDEDVEAAFRKFPHLRGCTPLRMASMPGTQELDSLVSSQLCMSAIAGDKVVKVTGVQMSGLLDSQCAAPVQPVRDLACLEAVAASATTALAWRLVQQKCAHIMLHIRSSQHRSAASRCCRYGYDGDLGDCAGRLSVWAPTAQEVKLLVFDSPKGGAPRLHSMARGDNGVWSRDRPERWSGQYYLYRCAHTMPCVLQCSLRFCRRWLATRAQAWGHCHTRHCDTQDIRAQTFVAAVQGHSVPLRDSAR